MRSSCIRKLTIFSLSNRLHNFFAVLWLQCSYADYHATFFCRVIAASQLGPLDGNMAEILTYNSQNI